MKYIQHITRECLLQNGWTNIFMKDRSVERDTLLVLEIARFYITRFLSVRNSENYCVLVEYQFAIKTN